MIYVTGDVHGGEHNDAKKLSTKRFPEQKKLTKEDFVIVCGDMGIVFDKPDSKYYNTNLYWQKWFSNKPYTTLFVDGNHENFDMLNELPIEEHWGGKVHKVCKNVYHLMRGEIYTLQGKTFFCFGGASSHDKWGRVEGISWWPQELATTAEMEYGLKKLETVNNKVDFILTHCASTSVQKQAQEEINKKINREKKHFEPDCMTDYFNHLEDTVEFKHWYFGHYHDDICIDNKHTLLYQKVIKIVD